MNINVSLFTACLLPLCATTMTAAELKQETIKAWDNYIQMANSHMTERARGGQFLWADETPERVRRLRQGEVVVSPVGEHSPKSVAHGLIHDWIGAAFIPNAKLVDLFAVVRDYGRYKDFYSPTVIDSKPVGQVGARE